MYITQKIADTVKLQAKQKKISIKDLLSTCELNINTISDFSRGQQISLISFARIADCLDCSIDYLLGRTNNPQSHKSIAITTGDNQNSAIGNVNSDIHIAGDLDTLAADLLKVFEKLDSFKKAKLLLYAEELEKSI